jgi:DNA-binding MarR family transcriptional regulator
MSELTTNNLARTCAAQIEETMPRIMRSVGGEMRRRHEAEISPAQFHILMMLRHSPDASLSSVARHLSTTLSSASKVVDGMVERGLISRGTDTDDRRRIHLALTAQGTAVLESFHREFCAILAEQLTGYTPEEFATILEAMRLLQRAFPRFESPLL